VRQRDPNKTTVTIRDVAKMSGFSASTVSIVLNNAPLARYIPPQTKARIQKAENKQSRRIYREKHDTQTR